MANLTDTIEEFILSMLKVCDNSVDLRRNELAEHFGCVPSQINYVIATRFTADRGYSTESKKGGGGYVRIIRHNIENDDYLVYLLKERILGSISFRECEDILDRLIEEGYISQREHNLILSSLKDTPIPLSLELKDMVRAYIMKNVILTILHMKEAK